MIDLHVHTNFSDGADDFITILKKAEKMNLCSNNGMFISGGSNYHGLNRQEVEIGIGKGNLRVSDEIIEIG